MTLELALDCKHYLGDRPCRYAQRCRCAHYEPMGMRVLIIKLGALGDVVRTACLLPTLHEQYQPVHVTWVTKPSGQRILAGHPQIDQLLAFDPANTLALTQQKFDLVISLDKEPAPTALAEAVAAPDKRGIGLSKWGTPRPMNPACESYFELGLDDELKFHVNRKSYPQLVHEALDLPYAHRPYELFFTEDEAARAEQLLAPWRIATQRPIVGLNTGSGAVFSHKAPNPDRWVQIARALIVRGYAPVLLGGPSEVDANAWIARRLDGEVFDTGGDHTESEFTAVVDQCDTVVAGDTLALHVAVARKAPVVVLFGPTCAQEIELFGRGEKIISQLPCGPCYKRDCTRMPSCTDAIDPEQIAEAVSRVCPAETVQERAS